MSRKRKWFRRSIAVVLLGLAGFSTYAVDRMAVGYLTGPRRTPGRDYWGGEVPSGGQVPGFAFLGWTAPSDNLPGVKITRPFEKGREIGLQRDDVILSVDGNRFENGRELYQSFIRSHSAGDVVTLLVGREGEPSREIPLTLEPFLRDPGDLGLSYENVEIPSASGSTLRGWFIPPPEGSDGRAGVFVHGLWSSRFQALEHGARLWHRRGYGLLSMDLTGHGTSDGKYVTYSIKERLDVASMLQWLRDHHGVARERVVVFGTSAGAAAAIYAVAQDGGVPALALDAPFSDLWTAAGEMLASRGMTPFLRYPLLWAIHWRAGIDLRSVRPIDVVSDIRAPVLFIHGDADDRIPHGHSERMVDVRRKAGLPTELWILPGGEHGFDNYPPEGIFWSRVLDFFDRALGGSPPAREL